MGWTQIHDPLSSPVFSTILASLPIVLLLGLLATGKVAAHRAALAGLICALAIAIFAYVPAMPWVESNLERIATWAPSMFAAALNGAAFGLLPIGWIVLAAIFLYTLTVESGQFEIVKHSVAGL